MNLKKCNLPKNPQNKSQIYAPKKNLNKIEKINSQKTENQLPLKINQIESRNANFLENYIIYMHPLCTFCEGDRLDYRIDRTARIHWSPSIPTNHPPFPGIISSQN